MTEASLARVGNTAARDELTRLVYDGTYERVHADVRAALLDPVFDPRENLTPNEAGRLAYQRSRFIHGRLERPLEILRNPLRLFALAEWPSLADVSTFSLLMVHYNLALGTLVDHGSDRLDLDDHVKALDGLSSFGPYMATELGYGNNVAALRTEAVYDPADQSFTLNTPDSLARKFMSYSGFQDIPKLAVVLARLKAGGKDHGVHPFIVPISDDDGLCEGVHAAPCPEKPVQGLDNGITWFDDVKIPRRNLLLGDMGEFTEDGTFRPLIANPRRRFLRAMSRIQPGRICVSSAAMSAGRAAVYIALRYSMRRLTNAPGGKAVPIIEYRSHQVPLLTALAKVYAGTFLLNHVKRRYVDQEGEISADLGELISITKALCTWEMTDVVGVCRERCGAQGMFSVNRIADYGSLLQGLVTAEGDNQVLLATTAGQLLARTDEESVPEVSWPDDGHMRSLSWQIRRLSYREHRLRQAVRASMVDDSRDRTYFAAWNENINAGLTMGRLRGARIALERFSAAVQDCADGPAGEALTLLAELYGLTVIEPDAGWYLANDMLSPGQVDGLPGAIDSLCARLLPYVGLLIDGFRLSPELLRAPIAADDYVSAFEKITCQRSGEF
jgi:acyl-CoA oxidase